MVRVLLFAGLQEIAGNATITLVMNSKSFSIADVKAMLVAQFPEMKSLLLNCMAAVNQEYATDDMLVEEKDEIAFIPPVSGG